MKPTFNSFEELEHYLKEWTNFRGNGIYDSVGIILLLSACLKNISTNCHQSFFKECEDIASFFSEEEFMYLKELVLAIEVEKKK